MRAESKCEEKGRNEVGIADAVRVAVSSGLVDREELTLYCSRDVRRAAAADDGKSAATYRIVTRQLQ